MGAQHLLLGCRLHTQACVAGEAEPVAKTSTGKPILDLYTHSAEDRVCKGPEDYVLRQVTATPILV